MNSLKPRFNNVLFDLDGTLTDPFLGITGSIQYALRKLGVFRIPDAKELAWCIGPPLQGSFAQLLETDDPERISAAMTAYRDCFGSEGLFENELISGIPDVLEALSKAGVNLFVATSKPHVYARRIIEHFGLSGCFREVYGAELDGTRSQKSELIAYILERETIAASDCAMIGDRKHDLIGGAANQVAGIGVLWGYGSREELLAEKPLGIAETPTELLSFLSADIL
ncbi:MAG: HAD hydrolase-like protein [Rhodobacteraceae bacterium]|nr:HAD hydrolase-like protein [Paracoccaceae bacterium]